MKEFYLIRDDFTKAQFGSFELSTMDRAGVFDTPDNRTGKDDIDPVNR
ncbi:MAG: hypothetical protein LBB83_12410 [Treponema sp.]|nr:hypothetical protein [Treponema sp.]